MTEEHREKPWLVVEDEDDIRGIIKVLWGLWGYTTLEFRDGNQAFAWLDQIEAGTYSDPLPDLALMDIRMPGHFGNEIARRMRSLEPFKHIPIVLMTAFSLSDAEREKMLKEDGVDHIISKPLPEMFELKALLEDIHKRKTQPS